MSSARERRRKYGMHGLGIDQNMMAVHDWNIDPWGFEMYLVGEPEASYDELELGEPGVEFQMANRLIKNLRFISMKDPTRPVLIHMKSCGGYWTEGMAIHDAIKLCPNKVTILSYTHARSMTSLILQAADKRVLMPHSYFLIHDGTESQEGTVKSVISAVEYTKITKGKMLDIYVDVLKHRGGKFTKWSPSKIRAKLVSEMNKREDVYLTAKEAVSWGFADAIFDGKWQNLLKYYPRQRQQ